MSLFSKLVQADNLPTHKKVIELLSPLSGRVCKLDDVPDSLYQQRLFGEGCALTPSGYQVFAPFTGTVSHFSETGTLLRITSKQGFKLQIHFANEAEKMMGEGFKRKIKVGEEFTQGQVLLEFDLQKMKRQLSTVWCMITLMNSEKVVGIQVKTHQVIAMEDPAMLIYL